MSLQNSKNINLILNAPVPFTLYKLALPNIFAVFMYSAVTFSEAWYIGQISIDELASLALVFPFVSLIGMMIIFSCSKSPAGVSNSPYVPK